MVQLLASKLSPSDLLPWVGGLETGREHLKLRNCLLLHPYQRWGIAPELTPSLQPSVENSILASILQVSKVRDG